MLFNKQQIESSIIKNEDLGLYEVKLPGIRRQFESIYYSFEGNKKEYGNLVSKFYKINLGNRLVGITRFNNYYIICFIDLTNLESEYFFVKIFDIFDVNLDGQKYYIFVYKDFKNKIGYITNYKSEEYNFSIDKNIFVIKNNIFNTEVFSKKIIFNNILYKGLIEVLEVNNDKFLDIADFFIYDDYFRKSDIKNYNNFCKFLENINNKTLKTYNDLLYKINITEYNDLYYPKIKINLSILLKNKKYFELKDFRKLLLSFFSENIPSYIINSKDIQDYFNDYFNDFTNIKIDDLKLDFDIPKNIYNSDILFEKFKLDLLKLGYNLYTLKESYKLNNKQLNENNEHIKLVNKKIDLNKDSLEKTIINYENMFRKLLEKIEY